MILYTPLSEHDIFPRQDESNVVYHKHKNCPVKCMDDGNGKRQIVQVLSTDPSHYMDPELQPGQWLDS
ncbi:YlzJ-like family protein [Halobacillus locisalis]|uniref:YlzJ-like family protein n=1 Tax=Halobacillus locisalis TaxID=220753 RepID=A0A838CQA7_9BACI|nr:YlzJ-like family protein [Halobacillus locisalis]MBA2174053.1 YlzJ-like family protein [Halobacillus locisalis]